MNEFVTISQDAHALAEHLGRIASELAQHSFRYLDQLLKPIGRRCLAVQVSDHFSGEEGQLQLERLDGAGAAESVRLDDPAHVRRLLADTARPGEPVCMSRAMHLVRSLSISSRLAIATSSPLSPPLLSNTGPGKRSVRETGGAAFIFYEAVDRYLQHLPQDWRDALSEARRAVAADPSFDRAAFLGAAATRSLRRMGESEQLQPVAVRAISLAYVLDDFRHTMFKREVVAVQDELAEAEAPQLG